MNRTPTAEELAERRAQLQRELFRLLDEQRFLRIWERHPSHWRWKERFNAARAALQAHDAQWAPTPADPDQTKGNEQ